MYALMETDQLMVYVCTGSGSSHWIDHRLHVATQSCQSQTGIRDVLEQH
jgi:hypothetical protein